MSGLASLTLSELMACLRWCNDLINEMNDKGEEWYAPDPDPVRTDVWRFYLEVLSEFAEREAAG